MIKELKHFSCSILDQEFVNIHFWKGLFTGSPKIPKSEPYELQEKSFCGRSLKFDVTCRPQGEMLLPLHLWKELLQISFEPISESQNQKVDIFLISTLCQKVF